MRTHLNETMEPAHASGGTYFDREVGWLRRNERESRWMMAAIFTLLALYLVAIAKFSGPVNVFHNDVFVMLDYGWRVLNGQVPHRDFYCALGPLEPWIVAAGMWLARGGAQGIAIGTTAFGLLIGLWGWLLARQRMPAVFSLLVTVWLVLTATAPTPLGFDPRFLSCAMIYNRQGYALLGIILIECAYAQQKSRFWAGASSGVALVLLAFLKLNFFGVAGLILLASIPIRRNELVRMWGFLAGCCAATLAACMYPRFSIAAFLSDMSFAAHARGSSLSISGLLRGMTISARSGPVWIILAVTAILILFTDPEQRLRRPAMTFTLLSVVVLVSGPLFAETNALESGFQLGGIWMIVLLDRISTLHLSISDRKTATVILVAACLGGIAAVIAPDVASAVTLSTYRASPEAAARASIQAPGMQNLRFYDSTSFYDVGTKGGDGDGRYFVSCINDGLSLVRSNSKNDESILTLGFFNPFSYLLRRRPAEGGSSFLLVRNSISIAEMPSVDRVFGNADLMILPDYEGTHRSSDLYIQDYYRTYLLEHFHFAGRSQYWSLYRRNK